MKLLRFLLGAACAYNAQAAEPRELYEQRWEQERAAFYTLGAVLRDPQRYADAEMHRQRALKEAEQRLELLRKNSAPTSEVLRARLSAQTLQKAQVLPSEEEVQAFQREMLTYWSDFSARENLALHGATEDPSARSLRLARALGSEATRALDVASRTSATAAQQLEALRVFVMNYLAFQEFIVWPTFESYRAEASPDDVDLPRYWKQRIGRGIVASLSGALVGMSLRQYEGAGPAFMGMFVGALIGGGGAWLLQEGWDFARPQFLTRVALARTYHEYFEALRDHLGRGGSSWRRNRLLDWVDHTLMSAKNAEPLVFCLAALE